MTVDNVLKRSLFNNQSQSTPENMIPQQFLSNLTIVSVFQLIFVQQNYRTVNFYSDRSQNEVLNKIIQMASDSMKPFKHMNIDRVKMNRSSYDAPILNIVVVNDLRDVNKALNENCLHETTVIWSILQNDTLNHSLRFHLSSKVIVLTSSKLYTVNNFVQTKFENLSLTNFSSALTSKFLSKFFSIESIRGSSVTIFTEFNAPLSEFTRIGNDLSFFGPDGIVAEALVESLNIKPTFSSSVTRKHPDYEAWLNSSILSPRLRYQYYHSAVLTTNVVTVFNHK